MSRLGKVVVAMSGGVDSSVAACLLRQQGYEVVGVFMRVGSRSGESSISPRHQGCCSAADAADARRVASHLGIRLYVLNFERQFEQLIELFADEYARGRTPNPCIVCNRLFKFGRLADYARAIDADFVATGHHARIIHLDGRAVLARGRDPVKDQSYVLFSIDRDLLEQTLLPIGELTRREVRDQARRFGLPVADKPKSQDICFVPERDYAGLVRQRRPEAFRPGPVRHSDGRIVGQHTGLANFTIGQRRGLGIALGQPVYVSALDARTNAVTVGPRRELLQRGLIASRCNWLIERPTGSFRAEAKIRYTHRAAPATIEPLRDDQVRVVFEEPQSAITPGQAVVFYDRQIVLGGGWIERSFRP